MNPQQIKMRHERPDDFARELTEQMLRSDQEMKIETCANGPDDLPNRVIYVPDKADDVNMILPMSIGPQSLRPADEIGMCASMGRQQFGAPFLIGFCAEAYMQTSMTEKELPTQRGVLSMRFAQGDKNVSEALTIFVAHRTEGGRLRFIGVQLPYHYGDGSVIFGEPTWVDSKEDGTAANGNIPEALVAAFGSEQN